MYKPPDNHVSDIELLIQEELTSEVLSKISDDVSWMLQTDSYRLHYLDRLEQLEQKLVKLEEGKI